MMNVLGFVFALSQKSRGNPLDNRNTFCYYNFARGGIAQLGERLNGIQEVSGSIPLISTKGYDKRLVFVRKQAFTFSKTTYRDEVGTIHRHSIFSPTRAVFTIRENGPFFIAQMRFTMKRIFYIYRSPIQNGRRNRKYFTNGSHRAFEQLMQSRPDDHYDSGMDGLCAACRSCRCHRPYRKDRYCKYAECPYALGRMTAVGWGNPITGGDADTRHEWHRGASP